MVFFPHLTIVCPTFISCGELWRFMRVWWNDLMLIACPLFWLMVRCLLPQWWGELFDRYVKMWKEESTACLGGLFHSFVKALQLSNPLYFQLYVEASRIWLELMDQLSMKLCFVSTFLMLQFMLKYLRNDQSRMLISTPNYFLEAAFDEVWSPNGSWLIMIRCQIQCYYWLRHWDAGGHKWYDKFVIAAFMILPWKISVFIFTFSPL